MPKRVIMFNNGIKMCQHEQKLGLWWLILTQNAHKKNTMSKTFSLFLLKDVSKKNESQMNRPRLCESLSSLIFLACKQWDRNTKWSDEPASLGGIAWWATKERGGWQEKAGESRTEAGRPRTESLSLSIKHSPSKTWEVKTLSNGL